MKTLFLIDANSLIHRCFHALPPLSSADHQPTGAIYGLASILIKIMREQKPDFIMAFFDRPEPTFRKEMFEEYKIHRPKAPSELVSQIIEAHHLFDGFKIKTFEIPGFEADDLIGTAVEKFQNYPDLKIIILTGDLDILQLIKNDKIVVETLKRGVSETIIYDQDAVRERYGIEPGQLLDYKGLVGDPSDNIPGVPGVGPKTATGIIQKYGDLEKFLESGKEEKAYQKISEFREQAILSRKLATIKNDAPLNDIPISDLTCSGLPKETITPYFDKLGFKTLINRINSF